MVDRLSIRRLGREPHGFIYCGDKLGDRIESVDESDESNLVHSLRTTDD